MPSRHRWNGKILSAIQSQNNIANILYINERTAVLFLVKLLRVMCVIDQ